MSEAQKETGKATVILRQQTWEVEAGITARELLQRLNLNPQSYLVTREGELISEDTIIRPGDQIRLVAVISGG